MNERMEERLRRAAQTYRRLGNHSAEGMFLEAADTITELRDDLQRANAENARLREENQSIGMAAYEVGYKNGSVHYELEHCPACKNIADLQEALEENAKLRDTVATATRQDVAGTCHTVYLVEISDELLEDWLPCNVYLHREAAEDRAKSMRKVEDGVQCYARVTEMKVVDG